MMDNFEYESKVLLDFGIEGKIAEYMTLARILDEHDPLDKYQKANALSWELAMKLPADLYKMMVKAIAEPNNKNNNPLNVVCAFREAMLSREEYGILTPDDIAHHAPGIGGKK